MSEEIKRKIDEIGRGFEEFKRRNDQRLAEIEKRGTAAGNTEETVTRINEDITAMQKTLKDLETRMNRPKFGMTGETDDPRAEVRRKVFEKFLRYGLGDKGLALMTEEERQEVRSLAEVDGGYLVPAELEPGIVMEAYNAAELRPYANTNTTTRDRVDIPSIAKPRFAWGRSGIAVTPQELEAGNDYIEIVDLKGLILIANSTLEDSGSDVIGELTAAFGMGLAEEEDNAFAAGDGVAGPLGIISTAEVQARFHKTGVAAALTDDTHNGVDALMSLLYAVKKTYRRNGIFVMNSTTEEAVRKIRNSSGDYLWQPSVQAGAPSTLLGRPLVNSEGMPDVAANSFPVCFGDMKQYRIRDRKGITIQRIIEKYCEYDQTAFLVKKRLGGKVILAEAFTLLKVAADA